MRKPPHLLPRSRKRRGDAPSEHVSRIGWLLLRLLYEGSVEYAVYCDYFGRSSREFQRDLHKLRSIGDGSFTISRLKSGRALMQPAPGRFSALRKPGRTTAATLSRIAAALGGPIQRVIEDGSSGGEGFLHLREPRPSANETVTRIFEFLRSAADGPAMVEFAYTARGMRTMRRVEPYHVIVRYGRYYLLAYDMARKDWRQFGLDAIEERTLRKVGSFMKRSVPPRFLAERSLGWICGSNAMRVTVRVTAVVAGAVAAREWQREQQIVQLSGGGAEVSFSVDDPAEAIRWALQFGPEAAVVAPPQAVALARDILSQMARAYDELARQSRIAG